MNESPLHRLAPSSRSRSFADPRHVELRQAVADSQLRDSEPQSRDTNRQHRAPQRQLRDAGRQPHDNVSFAGLDGASIVHPCWRGKRQLDIIGAVVLAAMFSPVILAVSLWLRLSGGPVLYRQTRIGRGGVRFTCYKFATMFKDADRMLADLLKSRPDLRAEWARDQKLKYDPRVTRLGALLRKTSMDELPQLWNVLKGEMSLVGPRPIVQEEIFKYRRAIRHYLAVKPGITGLWQVSGRNDTTYRRRVAMDRTYASRSSFVFDAWVLLRTVLVVAKRSGAY